jgi:4-amino-4-deoxy-L-arabinose transferase-like glycosyltransferase
MPLVLLAAWALPGVLGHDPWKPDEAYSFGLVYEILNSGSWLVPLLAGEPFMEKPPLYYLTAAATAEIFSPPLALHDAARIASACYMALCATFLALAARKLFGPGAGSTAVALLLGCVGLVAPAHLMVTDIALLAGFAMALYGLANSIDRYLHGAIWFGTGIGVGFMAKGLIAPGVLAAVAIALPAVAALWRTRQHVAFLTIAAVAAAPWLLVWPGALFHESPPLFNEWFWNNNFGRYFGLNDLGPVESNSYYLKLLPWFAFPALPLAAGAIAIAWREHTFGIPMRLLVLLTVIMFAVLIFAKQAREIYALPLLLPLCTLGVVGVQRLPDRLRTGWVRASGIVFSSAIAALWLGWLALERAEPALLSSFLGRHGFYYTAGPTALGLFLAVSYTAAWVLLLRNRLAAMRPELVWTAGMSVAWTLTMTLFIHSIDAGKTYRHVFTQLQSALPRSYGCVSSRNLGEPQRAMLQYFVGVVTYREEVPERRRACDLLLVQRHPAADWPHLTAELLWEGGRLGDTVERYRLYRLR